MLPEELAKKINQALPDQVRSIVLYGSAAAGDFVPGSSNYNVLVVLDRVGTDQLNAISEVATKWSEAGNPPPLLFTPSLLARSFDVFPIEFLDIQQSHKILSGQDPLAGVSIRKDHLRHELEHELKGKLIQLRERYLLTAQQPERVYELLIHSLTTFLVLCRAALRLYVDHAPQNKMAALQALTQHIPFDLQPFETLHEYKQGSQKPDPAAATSLFAAYVESIEKIVESIDQHQNQNTL